MYEKYSPKLRFNQMMSERRKLTVMDYDTDNISKKNSEPIYSPNSNSSKAYSQARSFKSIKGNV